MLEKALIVSLIVIFIHLTFQEGEIFGSVGKRLARLLPVKLHKPVFSCPICMTPWWGSLIIFVASITGIEVFQGIHFWDWLFILAIGAGISTVYVEMKPKKEIIVQNNY